MPVYRRRSGRGGAVMMSGGDWSSFRNGAMNFLKKTNAWLRKTHAISNVGKILGEVGVPYASQISNYAGKVGYGYRRRIGRPRVRRVRRRVGAGLKLPGGMFKKRVVHRRVVRFPRYAPVRRRRLY